MIRAEQMVYTTADIDGKKGYQVVAKSSGIDGGIESRLQDRFHPHGVPPADFRESHSLVDVGGGRVAYCHARNIGVGYDGRRDTLCSHVLVVEKDEFRRHGCDTRALAPLHPGGRTVRGELPGLRIDPPRLAPAGMDGLESGPLCEALDLLLDGKRTAVESGDPAMAQNLLSVLPPSLRLVQFTSLAVDAGDFSRYDLVFFPPRRGPGRGSGFATVRQGRGQGCAGGSDMLGRHIEHYAQAALGGDPRRLERIHGLFEASQGPPNRDRMALACAYERFREAPSAEAKKACAEDVLSVAREANVRSLPECLGGVRDYMEPRRGAAEPFPAHPDCSSSDLGGWYAWSPVDVAGRLALGAMVSFNRAVGALVDGGGDMRPQGSEVQRGMRRVTPSTPPPAAGMPAGARHRAPRPAAKAEAPPPPVAGAGDPAAGGSRRDAHRSRGSRPQRPRARGGDSRASAASPHAPLPAASPPSRLSTGAKRLLESRHVLSAEDCDFAQNNHYGRLYGGALDGPEKPAVLFTACPHNLIDRGMVTTGDFAEWVESITCLEAAGHRFPVRTAVEKAGSESLTAVERHPAAPPPANVKAYREFQDTGLFEYGALHQYVSLNDRGGHSLHLCRLVGEFWGFLLHARLFYQKIGTESLPFTVLLSIKNSSLLALGNWGDEATNRNWHAAKSPLHVPCDPCTARRNIHISYRFASAGGPSGGEAARTARDAAQKICSAYGEDGPKCYDKSGRFAWRLWEAVSR